MTATSRILIVDDEPQIRGFLSLTFENAGYTVTTAANGRDAIALLSAEAFDLLLSDVMMPEMNGHQLAQWAAAHFPEVPTILNVRVRSRLQELRRLAKVSLDREAVSTSRDAGLCRAGSGRDAVLNDAQSKDGSRPCSTRRLLPRFGTRAVFTVEGIGMWRELGRSLIVAP